MEKSQGTGIERYFGCHYHRSPRLQDSWKNPKERELKVVLVGINERRCFRQDAWKNPKERELKERKRHTFTKLSVI